MSEKLSDNIYFTRKARIQASERLFSNDRHSQYLLTLYSLINVCLSVVVIKKPGLFGENDDLLLVVMSIVILCVSLIVSSKNFKGRALSLKSHYIELHKLYYDVRESEKDKSEKDKSDNKSYVEKYTKLLELEENHKSIDDIIYRVFNNTTRKAGRLEKIRMCCYYFTRFLTLVFLYFFPFVIILVLLRNECI